MIEEQSLSPFQYLFAALAQCALKRGKSKASHCILRCLDLGNILHADAPRRVTCCSRREIRIVWSNGICKLPVVSEVFGNAVSGDAGMSSSSSCCPPISLLRWPPKPHTHCCITRSYTSLRFLVACVYGASDTCPVILSIHLLPTAPPIHYIRILVLYHLSGSFFTAHLSCSHHTFPSATPHPPSHNFTLRTLTHPLHQSSPPLDTASIPSSESRNNTDAVSPFGSAVLDRGRLRV